MRRRRTFSLILSLITYVPQRVGVNFHDHNQPPPLPRQQENIQFRHYWYEADVRTSTEGADDEVDAKLRRTSPLDDGGQV